MSSLQNRSLFVSSAFRSARRSEFPLSELLHRPEISVPRRSHGVHWRSPPPSVRAQIRTGGPAIERFRRRIATTRVPAVVDLACMRDAMKELDSDPEKINPLVTVDLVVDHSVQVDVARNENALQANMELEFHRNKERFAFLKWGSTAFHNMLVVPPGSGIVHQIPIQL